MALSKCGLKKLFHKFSFKNPSLIAKELNIKLNTFFCYWYGTRTPPPEIAYKIAQYLTKETGRKITLEDIYGLKDDEAA